MIERLRQTIRRTLGTIGAPGGLRRGGSRRPVARPILSKRNRYAAVTVQTDVIACAAVERYIGRRVLVSEAPSLPVPGCTAKTCECRFVKYPDRRAQRERRIPFSQGSIMFRVGNIIDRRKQSDRRTDESDADSSSGFDDH